MTATQTVNGPWNSKDLQQEKYTKDKKIVSTGADPPEQIWKVKISPYFLVSINDVQKKSYNTFNRVLSGIFY